MQPLPNPQHVTRCSLPWSYNVRQHFTPCHAHIQLPEMKGSDTGNGSAARSGDNQSVYRTGLGGKDIRRDKVLPIYVRVDEDGRDRGWRTAWSQASSVG